MEEFTVKEYGFRVDVEGSYHMLVSADNEEEAEKKLHAYFEENRIETGIWSWRIDKGPTDRYEDSKEVRIIRPKKF